MRPLSAFEKSNRFRQFVNRFKIICIYRGNQFVEQTYLDVFERQFSDFS